MGMKMMLFTDITGAYKAKQGDHSIRALDLARANNKYCFLVPTQDIKPVDTAWYEEDGTRLYKVKTEDITWITYPKEHEVIDYLAYD